MRVLGLGCNKEMGKQVGSNRLNRLIGVHVFVATKLKKWVQLKEPESHCGWVSRTLPVSVGRYWTNDSIADKETAECKIGVEE